MIASDEKQYNRQAHQAFGIVAERIGGTISDAVVLIEAHAAATGCSVDEVAKAAIDGRLRFDK